MARTDRLGLPLLAAGQAQKEVTHNEALSLIDIAAVLTFQSADLATPPVSPELGGCWIVAEGATGDWLDRDGQIAGWTNSGWRFLEPQQGWRGWAVDRENMVRCHDGVWIDESVREDGIYVASQRIIASRQAAIADVIGGALQDAEARLAINEVLETLREHGLIES